MSQIQQMVELRARGASYGEIAGKLRISRNITDVWEYRRTHPHLAYSEDAWRRLVEHATIHPDGLITFTLKDGTTHTA